MRQLHIVSTSTDQTRTSHHSSEAGLPAAPPNGISHTQRLPVKSILPADSPRLGGEDVEHTRMLARIDAKLPPIIVHRASMRVIDGTHRLGAALLKSEETIDVRFFDGSEQEAFVLAVTANIAHGRPLSLADRTVAVERIIAFYPTWSDRAIAAAAGIGARTVGSIRRRLESTSAAGDEVKVRMGRDGRMRPIDNAEGRLKAAEVIRNLPDASLREIAKKANVSPSTARDVRNRLMRGDDPVPSAQRSNHPPANNSARELAADRIIQEPDLDAILRGLKSDPSLRFTECGRNLLRWTISKVLHPGEWGGISTDVPPHCTYIMADVARRCADEWLRIADDLERRSRHVS